jgi:predicted nucleic acid-binding protein
MFMNKYIFVDTWAWLALSNRKDMHYELAKKWYGEMKAAGYIMVTSDYVLDEVITTLFKNVVFSSAIEFIDVHFKHVNLGFDIIPKEPNKK